MFEFKGLVIHIDPVFREADHTKMPKADLVLVTHEHGDHLDPNAIKAIAKDDTQVVVSASCAGKLSNATVMRNGDALSVSGIPVEAVPAYNIVHERSPGHPFHPKGNGNGYILTFGNRRVYVAGDTENTPELKAVTNIDIAFLPMNLPYTMTPEMVADAARALQPKILYPYHFGDTDTTKLKSMLADEENIDVRIRHLE
jgi:L-ascorbate metabolism protein UlaG (beta-lactamase superfamily)